MRANVRYNNGTYRQYYNQDEIDELEQKANDNAKIVATAIRSAFLAGCVVGATAISILFYFMSLLGRW